MNRAGEQPCRSQASAGVRPLPESTHDCCQIKAESGQKRSQIKRGARGNQDKRGPGQTGALTGEVFAKFVQSRDYQRVDVTIERLY
jgi:hypothetical protein